MTRRIEALVRTVDGGFELAAPAVGWFAPSRANGDLVGGGAVIGRMECLGERLTVVVPAGVVGELAQSVGERVGAEYGRTLFRVTAAALGDVTSGAATPASGSTDKVIRAQMDGQFYRRPSPEEPEFISEGQTIGPGTTIGLIEVMKFFYPVVFEGPGEAVVQRLIAEDSTPVEAGDPLISVG